MKKLSLLLPFLLFIHSDGFASFDSGNPALIQYHSFSSQLDSKSDTLRRKYFQIHEMNLQPDEMVLIKYISFNFAVSLYVRSASGDTVGSVEIPKYYSDKGSHLAYLFKQEKGGRYQFLFTSKDSL
jgi:hypothetical protein